MSKRDIAIELHRSAMENYTRRRVRKKRFMVGRFDRDDTTFKEKHWIQVYSLCDCFMKFAWAIPFKQKRFVK